MKQLRVPLLTFLGCVLIVSGIAFLAMDGYAVHAQDELPEFVGADECESCHRNVARDHSESNHALALQDVGRRKSGILGDFDLGEDTRTVLLPGEETARAFTEDDVAFTVGAGRYVQRYLYEVDRNEYMVLPAEWNVASQAWEPLQLAETWPSDAYDWEQNCAYCHTTGYDVQRERWEDDGVQCEACHGPGSVHVELAEDAGRNPNDEELLALRSAIYTAPDPQVCGQCHSQGVGQDNLPYPAGYLPGTDLSQVFQLVPNDSADHWWASGHAKQQNMQYNEWFNSTHSSALSDMLESSDAADECLTCHSGDARQTAARIAAVDSGDREGQPPDAVTTETAQWGVTCTTCHYPHTDSEQPSDLVQEANGLCESCHTNPPDNAAYGIHHPVKEMFEGVPLVSGIDGVPGVHFTAEDGPRCMTCHMQSIPVDMSTRISHRFTPVLPDRATAELPSACSGCHQDLTITDLQLLVDDTQAAVHTRLSAAQEALGNVPEPPADSEDQASYAQVVAALAVVENDGSFGIHNYAYTDALLSAAEHDLAVLNGSAISINQTAVPVPTAVPTGQITLPVKEAEPVSGGVRPVTVVVIGGVIALLLTAAALFFSKSGDREGQ